MSFKLTKHDGLTRRISFPNLPYWNELAEKISGLYSIPLDKVAVSYVDAEEDEVTLSTNEELQDYYQSSSRRPGQVIKFTVHDLSASRLEDKSLPQTPISTGNVRNTFGREPGLPFNIDSDWQKVPLFAMATDGPHAFVEVVPTDASSITSRPDNDEDSDTASEFTAGPRVDKGKAKAVDPMASTVSLLGEKVGSKYDLHVLGVPTSEDPFADLRAPSVTSSVPTVSAPVESTPKAKTLDADAAAAPADDLTPFESPDPSLTQDIAALLSTLSSIVSSHPELSEGLRNIVRNSANGSYWQTHREALRTAAQNLSQNASTNAQALEEEAGRRVAEALGNIFRAIAQIVGPFSPTETEHASDTNTNPPFARQGWRGRGGPPRFGPFWHRPPFPPPFPPAHGPHGPHGPFMPPPGPPPRMNDGWSSFWGGQSAPSAPPPEPKPKPTPQELRAQVEAAKLLYKAEKERYRQEREERKKEKERRLRLIAEAEIQQHQPIRSKAPNAGVAAPAQPAQPAQIVSQARGAYPQLEMFSVPPRRHNTLPPGFGRPGGHRAEASQSTINNENPSVRAMARINRKLTDMGFTEHAHPELPAKIKAQIPQNSNITKENEDDIVTNLLEELIVQSPKGPQASSSGIRDKDDIPGAWH